MAKIKFFALFSEKTPEFSGNLVLEKRSATSAEYYDEVGKIAVVLTGTNLTFKQGEIVSGTIKKIEYENQFGEHYLTFSDIKIKADHLSTQEVMALSLEASRGDDLVMGSTASDVYLWGATGNDTIIGLNGSDRLIGDRGNDTYTGKLRSDYFQVGYGLGKDVVTDFDANGGADKQDYLLISEEPDFRKEQKGENTIVDFGRGHTVTLLGVDANDITKEDFSYSL